MAPSFGRSISFPLSPARSSSSSSKGKAKHVRSISLPTSRGRTHPLLFHLQNTVRAARHSTGASSGLAHIDALLAALAELLLLPEARAGSATADCLLDSFLALADAYGAFQEAVVELKLHAAEVQAALRRRDAARLSSAVRAQRQAEKDIARLASSVHSACNKWPQLSATATAAEVEVSGMLAEAVAAIASASSAVFSAVEFISSAATTAASKKSSATIISFSLVVKRKAAASSSSDTEEKELAALQRLQDLDDCIADIEAGSHKVFRSILHTRVALLNIQTQTC